MSIDELRAGFSRLAEHTRPEADPYARLVARRRKRFRLRLTGLAAALLAAVMSAPLALQAGSAPPPAPIPTPTPIPTPFDPFQYLWLKRLIESPTRGELAGNAALIGELERAFIAKRGEDLVPAGLDRTRILFAHDISGVRHVLVSHHSDMGAYFVLRRADAAAGIGELMNSGPSQYHASDPFFVELTSTGDTTATAFGLAPAGCVISTPDGPVATGDYVVRLAAPDGEVWRVTCEGNEKEARSLVGTSRLKLKPDKLDAYKRFTGRDGAVRWNRDGTTVIAPKAGTGPAIVVLGDNKDGELALDPPDGAPRPTLTVGTVLPSLIGTGKAYASGDIVAVRMPERQGGGGAVGNRLLVLGPSGSQAEAIAGNGATISTVRLADGMGYLVVDIGAAKRIKVGSVSFDFNEPAEGVRLFEQPLFNRWD